jgi:RNA polymerase sigma factor (sigma-70 family)
MDVKDFAENDRYFNMFSSVGSSSEVQQYESTKDKEYHEAEQTLCDADLENWLLFMENERLHTALCSLPPEDQKFIFDLFSKDMTQREMALQSGISQVSVCKRWRKLAEILKKSLR